jgi:hypothetical protein
MRVFSKHELEYLKKLRDRNARLIRESSLTEVETLRKLCCKGLTNPLSVNERKIRQRIRDKAYTALADLVLAQCAGVIPDKKAEREGVSSLADLANRITSVMLLQMVTEGNTNSAP